MKLVIHQASTIKDNEFPLNFHARSTWFSEALLPTAFKARFQGDPLAETRTNADGVIGHFLIGEKAKDAPAEGRRSSREQSETGPFVQLDRSSRERSKTGLDPGAEGSRANGIAAAGDQP